MSKYAAPIRRAREETSPIVPPMLPRKTSMNEGNCKTSAAVAELVACEVAMLAALIPLITARGVAVVTASVAGSIQLVILTGHAASRIERAASAGFIKLWPRPPNTCLTSEMAIKEPITANHQGAVGGRLYANSNPVTTA